MTRREWKVGERCWVFDGLTLRTGEIGAVDTDGAVSRGPTHKMDWYTPGNVFATQDEAEKRLAALRAKGGAK